MDAILTQARAKLPGSPILLAIEAVPDSRVVITAALALARKSGAEIVVLSVREREYTRGLSWDRRPMSEIGELINSAIFEFDRAGIPARGRIRTARSGRAAQEIVEAARQHRASTIVIGTSARSWLGSLIFSSVSPRVVRMSEVPVVLVPTRRSRAAPQPAVSTSGSAAAPKR
jgi:nucleotide-binding universal stress UspA family protein